MKLCIIDTETTGVNPAQHGVIQISGKLIIDEKELPPFDLKVQPFPRDLIDDKALEINGVTREELFAEERLLPHLAKQHFIDILGEYVDAYDRTNKYILAGFNGGFDCDMLRQWFLKMGDKYFNSWFWWPPVDIAALALLALGNDRGKHTGRFTQTDVARLLGIEVDETRTHDSAYDIGLAYAIYCEAMRRLRGGR